MADHTFPNTDYTQLAKDTDKKRALKLTKEAALVTLVVYSVAENKYIIKGKLLESCAIGGGFTLPSTVIATVQMIDCL